MQGLFGASSLLLNRMFAQVKSDTIHVGEQSVRVKHKIELSFCVTYGYWQDPKDILRFSKSFYH